MRGLLISLVLRLIGLNSAPACITWTAGPESGCDLLLQVQWQSTATNERRDPFLERAVSRFWPGGHSFFSDGSPLRESADLCPDSGAVVHGYQGRSPYQITYPTPTRMPIRKVQTMILAAIDVGGSSQSAGFLFIGASCFLWSAPKARES